MIRNLAFGPVKSSLFYWRRDVHHPPNALAANTSNFFHFQV
uniref:Uncharacterized protein n=1 Tax=Rhizophora mucronata TaxID=61149 RepID=A0A2P2QRL3_RHIMU